MELRDETQASDIDLKQLVSLLLRKSWIIILAGIFTAIAAYMLSAYVMIPMYQSTTKIYVINQQDASSTITYSDLQTSSQLTNDYKILVTSRPVVESVIAELGLDVSYGALAGMISVSNPANTRILSITVKNSDPKLAQQIADAVREASAIHIGNVMNIDEVNVAEPANYPKEPYSPSVIRNAVIAGVIGVMLAAMLIILISMLDDTIKTPDDIDRYLGVSLLASIPIEKELLQLNRLLSKKDKKDQKKLLKKDQKKKVA
jgi:capsular polysaccharide biosynthesis protein